MRAFYHPIDRLSCIFWRIWARKQKKNNYLLAAEFSVGRKFILLWQFVMWRCLNPDGVELQCPVLHPVLVNVEIVEDFGAAGGGTGQQSLFRISHQPLVSAGGHFSRHVFLGPGVQPGLEASVQTCVHPLVGLKQHRWEEKVENKWIAQKIWP